MNYRVISYFRLNPLDITSIVHPLAQNAYMQKLHIRQMLEFDEILLVEQLPPQYGVLDPTGEVRKDVYFTLRCHIGNLIKRHGLKFGKKMRSMGGAHTRTVDSGRPLSEFEKIPPLSASVVEYEKRHNSAIVNTASYVGGVTKGVGDSITSNVEAVIDNPTIAVEAVKNVASTVIDGITYFPDVALDAVAPELSFGAKDRTNQRINNVIDGVSESIENVKSDYVKHQDAIASGDFEEAGKITSSYATAFIPAKKIDMLSVNATLKNNRRKYLNDKFDRSGNLNLDISVRGRKEKAFDFYKEQGIEEFKISSHLGGIDFNKSVDVITINKSKMLYQYQTRGAPQGNYYSLSDQTLPTHLGISPHGYNRELKINELKVRNSYITNGKVKVLKSTSKSIIDNWSVSGEFYKTDGGGRQLFTTDNKITLR